MGITACLRTLAQPFTLYIGPGFVADSLDIWQMQSVSVKLHHPADTWEFLFLDDLEANWQQEQQESDYESMSDGE
jgi:hypothetical protein